MEIPTGWIGYRVIGVIQKVSDDSVEQLIEFFVTIIVYCRYSKAGVRYGDVDSRSSKIKRN